MEDENKNEAENTIPDATDATENKTEAPIHSSNFELSDDVLAKLTDEITKRLTADTKTEETAEDADDSTAETDEDDKAEEPSPKIKKLNRENQTLRARAKDAEEKLLKIEVAIASGLPADLATRLNGTTKEELEKDAEALAELAGIKTISVNNQPSDGAPRGKKINQQDAESLSDIGARMFTR